MSILKQFSNEELERWDSRRLGRLYLESFCVSLEEQQEKQQLQRITNILKERPFEERLPIYHYLKKQHEEQQRQHPTYATKLQRAIQEYYKAILD